MESLEVHTFAWKMARCIKCMGVNDMGIYMTLEDTDKP